MKGRNILCVLSDVGGAHRSVAESITTALEKCNGAGDLRFTTVDIFQECSRFSNLLVKLYPRVIENCSWFYEWLYHFTDNTTAWNCIYKLMIASPMRTRMKRLIADTKPSLILSTFPLAGRISADVLQEMGLSSEIHVLVVVVDLFTIHRAWAEPRAHLTIVPTEEAAAHLIHYGVPSENISVCGFALRDVSVDPCQLRKELGFARDRFTVMVMNGGEGSRSVYEIVHLLLKNFSRIQIIAVAGRSEKARARLRKMRCHSNVQVFDYTDKVLDLMNVSDILITKAGPATLMEAVLMGLPVIITSWVSGQEDGNVEYVRSKGFAYIIKERSEIIDILTRLMNSKDELRLLKENIQKEKKSDGAREIASLVMKRLDT